MADKTKIYEPRPLEDGLRRPGAAAEGGAEPKREAWKTEIIEWAKALIFAVVVVLLFKAFIAEPIRVQGPSMKDTLFSDQIMFVYKTGYMLGSPVRQDVVVCHFPNSKDNFVKRVIGLPGETLEIRSGEVYVDGAALDEPYVVHPLEQNYGPVVLGEGEYFLMGDNRADSADSRSVGPIRKQEIIGKSLAVFWPIGQAHVIRHE